VDADIELELLHAPENVGVAARYVVLFEHRDAAAERGQVGCRGEPAQP